MSIETTLDHPAPSLPAETLRGLCGGAVHLPGDPGYEMARVPWNVSVDQRPAAVAFPHSADEAAELVLAAARAGLRVAPQSTGHAAGPLAEGSLEDVVIVRTSELAEVTVDPMAQTARVGGGVLWQQVVEAAAPHGLAALHGSSPDVAVAGYALGGGIGWYARKLGLAANSLLAVEIVTADGQVRRVDAESTGTDADLFWAVRGGGGNFGLVTALELRLYPIADAYAGMLLWDRRHAETVVREWARWSATAPDEVTTSLRVMSFPPMPELPEFLRGRQIVVIDGAVLGDDTTAEELLAPLRALSPEMDTFARVPAAALSRIHMDPEGPTPAVSGALLLDSLPEEAVEAFLAEVGHGSTSSLLFAELRQLGGALARDAHGAGALARVDAAYAGFFVAIAATPEMAAQGLVDAQRLEEALGPWSSGRSYLNFAETRVETETAFEHDTFVRLGTIRAEVDPDGVLVANHQIPVARGDRG
jgi:FAD/FMN-containing dehydrogenase